MKFSLGKWREYYIYAHKTARSSDLEEKLYRDIVLKECSMYLNECGLKMKHIPNPHLTPWPVRQKDILKDPVCQPI